MKHPISLSALFSTILDLRALLFLNSDCIINCRSCDEGLLKITEKYAALELTVCKY